MTQATIAVVGGGLMGAGIAQVFARAGRKVIVHEPFEKVRDTIVDRIRDNLQIIGADEKAASLVSVTGSLAEAVADAEFVTEAAPEKLDLKREIFTELIAEAPRNAILASNSSVMPVGDIANGMKTADRIVGTHWWNPAPLIPLVEVIQGAETSDATIEKTMMLLSSVGKKPAHVKKDVAG
ncbi:MAG: hypothetical protein KDA46_06045, partial [Parvularculaceae bacterium]|nr:hypothetical protein [Parvularculaceae bacterium]